MSTARTAAIVTLTIPILALSVLAGRDGDVTRTFDKKERVKINTVSGDCIIEPAEGDQIEVTVDHRYSPRGSFEPVFKERARSLRLSERMYGSNSGSSIWTVRVPNGTFIQFETASGNLSIHGVKGELSANTASGDIEVIDCEGMFELNTASGTIEIENCKGEFSANSASGHVYAEGVIIGAVSNFSTASGTVVVELGQTSDYDLSVGSASGKALLNYDGNPLKGLFELTAKERSGRILSSVDFDEEERFRRWGDRYVRKSFTRGSGDPIIEISTASGRAELKEK